MKQFNSGFSSFLGTECKFYVPQVKHKCCWTWVHKIHPKTLAKEMSHIKLLKGRKKKLKCPGEPKTETVVTVVRRVPEAVGRTYALWFIKPRAASQHTVRAIAAFDNFPC